ncbi:hypothetical protein [Caballeronia glebae]|uniref:hypothetical protein n=1 Tax=Caballeronia glebae TaxID=1777143 RepID=UPI0038B97924
MSESLAVYFEALERLKRRKGKINNDTVAIEAGRKKGSIKKSRSQHATLIAAIDAANEEVRRPQNDASNRLQQVKDDSKELRRQLDAAYARELSLAREVMELRRELKDLRGGNVIPIREPRATSSS